MTIRDIGRRFMTTKSCRNKIRYFADFVVALAKNPTAAKWFREHGTRDPIASIERWMAQQQRTLSPRRYTVRQSPTRGVAHKPVAVVRQPNNTMNIGVPITPRRTPSPKYTVRQSPTRGVVHRPVTVVRQPNNTMNIGIRRTPPISAPRPPTTRRRVFPSLRAFRRRTLAGPRPARRM
jgi:hypothetical protein